MTGDITGCQMPSVMKHLAPYHNNSQFPAQVVKCHQWWNTWHHIITTPNFQQVFVGYCRFSAGRGNIKCCIPMHTASIPQSVDVRPNTCWHLQLAENQWACMSNFCAQQGAGIKIIPKNKVHGANMGPRCRQDPGGSHVGPIKFSIWDIICYMITAETLEI